MLVGDKAKYIGILMGLCFATFIITQQAAILIGIMKRTYGFVTDVAQPDIWVMSPATQYIDDIQGVTENCIYNVRSIEGIEWAVPISKNLVQARLVSGYHQSCILIGIDNSTLIGQPPLMLEGKIEDLRMPDAIIVNEIGAETRLAYPIEPSTSTVPLRVGDVIELNDHRAYVAGICKTTRTFQSQPVVYTTYERADTFLYSPRYPVSFIVAKAKEGFEPSELCKVIRERTELAAFLAPEVKWQTVVYYLRHTGIAVNFGTAIVLGFIIGVAIAGQTLYNFTIGNLPYFGTLKAMGADNSILMKMILLQAFFVSAVGWGIGMLATTLIGFLSANTDLAFNMPLYLYLLSFASITLISLIVSFVCIRTVNKLDPAIVFKS